jgi:hypothetical protein
MKSAKNANFCLSFAGKEVDVNDQEQNGVVSQMTKNESLIFRV